MPTLTTATSSPLHDLIEAAKVRATKVAGREGNLVSAFALQTYIHEIKADQVAYSKRGDVVTSLILDGIIRHLQALIPPQRL